jgi:hypothetical protein
MSDVLYIAPGAAMRLETAAYPTNQVGTVGVRLRNLDTRSDTIARTTAGIAFDSDTGTHWIDTLLAPTTSGEYDELWNLPGQAAGTWPTRRVVVTGSLLTPLIGGGRASMADIITRVRLLINDPSSGSQVFSDAQLQQWLDVNRSDVRYLELTPEWQTSGSATQWFSFYDQTYGGNWETDAEIVGRSWQVVTPTTSDWLTGKWTFAASQLPPLMISGRTYDVYSAAADALEGWAAKVALDFDVSTGRSNLTANRSQKRAGLLEVAAQYRARGRSTSLDVIRSDSL